METREAEIKTPLPQKISCGTGSVLNEFFRQMTFSYEMLFFIKVIGLSGRQAGLVIMLGQVCDGALGPLVGYLSDQVTVPLISRPLGKRKAWHLIGVVLMSVFFPLLLARCLFCGDGVSQAWSTFAYFLFLECASNFAYSIMDIGHLSMISVFAKSQDEAVQLNVTRTLFTYGSGVCAYGVTWIVFGQDSEESLNPDSWRNFVLINCVLVGIGILLSGFAFQIGTKEPKDALPRRKVSSVLTKHGLMSAAMVFMVGSNLGDEEGEDRTDVQGRKVSFPLHKISSVLQFSNPTVGSELWEANNMVSLRKASAERKESSASRKLSAVRKISAYIVPFDTGLVEHASEDYAPDDEESRKDSAARRSISSLFSSQSSRPTSPGIKEEESEHKQEVPKQVIPAEEKGRKENEHEEIQTAHMKLEIGRQEIRKSSFPGKIVAASHVPEISSVDRPSPKSRIHWLRDPQLYKVSVIYAISRLIQDAAYSYMSFYLTDYLLFQKEATAFFPLILLICGMFGTAAAKVINKKIGSKWTFCIAAALVLGASVWLYFLTPASRAVTYAPTIIIGSGMSAMFVTALNFTTALIGEEKGTSGFVCSVTGLTAKFASGVFFGTVQYFYPSTSEGEDCPDCGPFVRYVLTLSLGLLSLLGLLIVLVFQKSGAPPRRKRSSAQGTNQRTSQAHAQTDSQLNGQQLTAYDTHDTRL